MVFIWTNIRGMYGPLYAVPEGTVTDFPFLRRREDWQSFQVLMHLAVRGLPPEVGDALPVSRDYHPGSPHRLGDEKRAFYVPGAMRVLTFRPFLGLLALYMQREVRDVPRVRRKWLCPTTPVLWELDEVPRGMAAPGPQKMELQGETLMGELLGGPYHMQLATLRAVEVEDLFVGSIQHQGHLWRLPSATRSECAGLTTERLCWVDPSVRPRF